MAGYSNFSMSNNAVYAYENGEAPASKIAGVPARLIRKFCTPSSWHHTSAKYNRTDFYDVDEVMATFGLAPDDSYDHDPEAIEALKRWKETKKALSAPVVFVGEITYTEFTGSWKRPKAIERTFKGEFQLSGDWVIFDGIRKKATGNHISGSGKRVSDGARLILGLGIIPAAAFAK